MKSVLLSIVMLSFVTVGRRHGRSSWRPSVGFIQFALGSFYADCPHKCIIPYIMKVYMERKNMQLEYDSVKNIAFIRIFVVEPMKSTRVARVFTLG